MSDRRTVLVVEDDADVRRALAAALRGRSFDVVEAEAGWKAKELADERVPDLILLDRRLPDRDGLELARLWRQQGAPQCAVPIIMLTGYASRADVEAALVAGCDAFLAKPCAPEVVMEHVTRAMKVRAPR